MSGGDDAFDQVLNAMAARAAADPNRKPTTYDDFQKMMDSIPLFMREAPTDTNGDYVLEALQNLAFEGEGDESALNFKNHGNELYQQRSYSDAIKTYSQGLAAGPKDIGLKTTLLNNRAAANLMLKNYSAVLKDTSAVLTLVGQESEIPKRDPPGKTYHRAAQALLALGRIPEAQDAVERGRALPSEEQNQAAWVKLSEDLVKAERLASEKQEGERRSEQMADSIRRAALSRGLIIETTPSPPENPNPMSFDKDVLSDVALYPPSVAQKWTAPQPHEPLVFPVFLLYPQYNTSDFISQFHEDTSFEQQLEPIFPASSNPGAGSPPWSDWDAKHEYTTPNLNVYVETSQKRLLKVGKEITLREVLAKGIKAPAGGKPRDGIVLRDGLLSFIVLPRGAAEKEWIEHFKKARDSK